MQKWSLRGLLATASVALSVSGSLALAREAVAKPTWLPATALTAGAGAGSLDAAMAADGAGTVVWEGASERVEAAGRMAFGSGFGPALALSPAGEKATYPQVADDGAGVATVVWVNASADAIETATVTDGLPAVPVKLTAGGANPSIAVNEGGAAVAAWVREDAGELLVEASFRPAGGSFGSAVPLSTAAKNVEDSQVAIDAGGEATVVWRQAEASSTVIAEATRSASSGTFSPSKVLSNAAETAREPSVAMNAAGDGAVAWSQASGSDYVAQIATRSAGGAFHAPVVVSSATADAEYPQVALDAVGEPTLAWMNASYIEVAEGSSAGYSAPARIAFTALYPSLAENEAGDAMLAWVDESSKAADASFRPAGSNFEAARTVSPAEKAISEAFTPGHPPPVVSAIDGEGDGLAAFELEGGTPYAALLDAAGPVLNGLAIPATGTAGKPVSFSVAPADQISSVASTIWSFGDATSESGASVSHTFADPGTYSVSVTSIDASGNSTTATGKIVISAEAPKTVVSPAKASRAFKGARLVSHAVRANRSGGVRLKVRCPRSTGCQGKVTLTLKVRIGRLPTAKISLGKDKFRAAAGARVYVTFKLRPALLKLLREDGRLKFSAIVESTDFRKQKASTTASGKVKAPKAAPRRGGRTRIYAEEDADRYRRRAH